MPYILGPGFVISARASRQQICTSFSITISVKIPVSVLLDQTKDVFLIKKKRDDADDGVGCSCKSTQDVCGDDCECRYVIFV